MQIQNHWQNHQVSETLISDIQSQIKTLPFFVNILEDSLNLDVSAFEKFQQILVFGIGGSSLGGQAIHALTNDKRLRFIDNIDPRTFLEAFETLDLKETGIVVISKSGNTAEPLMQLLLAKQLYEKAFPDTWMSHFAVLTENKDNALSLFAKKYSILSFDHPTDIGGRYNVFTSVVALIAGLSGFDFDSFKEGARALLKRDLEPILQGAVRMAHLHRNEHINQTVLMVYADQLELFAQWHAQLWAESLGKCHKNGHRFGMTPVIALGAVDQHSQLQLYLDGPRDKFITFITAKNHPSTEMVQDVGIKHSAFDALKGKTMGDLFKAEEKGTFDTLLAQGGHLRLIQVPDLTPFVLGELMIFFMIETIATAFVLDIDPFDQPAVEESKIRSMDYLKG